MTTICLTEETIAMLDNLEGPRDFCDESGRLLGSFIPETEMRDLMPIARVERSFHLVEQQLGPEMGIFGFKADLE